jgi:capsular polysaccharide biosynthesis protein
MNDWRSDPAGGTPPSTGRTPGEEPPTRLLTAGDYVAILRRRWLTLLVVPALAVITMWWWAGQQPEVYLSRSELFVRPLSSDPLQAANAQRLVNVFTEAEVVSSSAVLERALPALEPLELPQVQEQLDVEADDVAQIIRLRFEAATPQLAQEGAAAIADAYLDHRNEQALASVSHMTSRLDERARGLQEELDAATRAFAEASVTDPVDEGEIAALRSQESLLSSQLSLVMNELASRSLIEPTAAEILRPATMEPTPIGWGRSRLALISLVGGLLVAGGFALVRERLDGRVRSIDELERLAKAPTVERLRLDARGRLGTGNNDLPGRRLALIIRRGRKEPASVTAVTSAVPTLVTELIADALARALSGAGVRVLVVAPRWSADHGMTLTDRCRRLSSLARGVVASVPTPSYRRAEYDRTDPATDLEGVLGSVRDRYDHVVIAAPPVTESADLLECSASVDSVVLAVTVDRVRAATIVETVGLLTQHGTAPTVLVPISSAPAVCRSTLGAVHRLWDLLSPNARGVASRSAAETTVQRHGSPTVASPERALQPSLLSEDNPAQHAGAPHLSELRWTTRSSTTGAATAGSTSTGREGRVEGELPKTSGATGGPG